MTPTHEKVKSLSGKIFATVLAFTLAVIVVMSLALTCVFYFSSEHSGEQRLLAQARNAAAYLDSTSSEENVALLEEQFAGLVRFTLISADGEVLYDSAVDEESQLENHADRPEVIEAESLGEGTVSRYSQTLGTDTVYAAVLLDDGSIVRLSETRSSLLSFIGSLIVPIVLSLVVAALLVLLLSRMLTRRIMKPIDALDFAHPLDNEIYEEMDPLLIRIDQQQQQLKAQNKELARAESMRRDFSANVSHEMKTPLQVIAGYAELMKNGMVPPEDIAKFSGLIYEESQAMRSLINDVLTLSRLDESAFESDNVAYVDLRATADRVAGRLATLSEKRSVTVRVVGEHVIMPGNETLIEEMFYNLIENGIRYNHEGGRVTLTITSQDLDGNLVVGESERERARQQLLTRAYGTKPADDSENVVHRLITIRAEDNGPGIPPEKREKIFQRFYRLEKSRSKETGGTGLGLAIVKHAVMYHNGTIDVEGDVGEGTTFILKFPITLPEV